MDLAKIRKKHQQTPIAAFTPDFGQNTVTAAPAMTLSVPVVLIPDSPLVGFINSAVPETIAETPVAKVVTEVKADYRDPLQIILAGRKAAGCDEEEPDDLEHFSAIPEKCLEYLCFRVFDEIYGINIMDIKEIIKPREVTEVPCAPPFVSGIISLRGTIIPIIDMRCRLGLQTGKATGRERVVVIKNNRSLSGLLVDEVIKVLRLDKENLEPAPSVLEGVDRDFVTGIGRSEGGFIIILNLDTVADIHLF